MNKNIFIHADNITFIDEVDEDCKIKFHPRFSDIDKCISKDIIRELSKKTFDVIYIKDNLSSNYFELLGLRVALHIRLSTELDKRRFAPIVIVSEVDSYILNKLSTYAKVLFTKNIYVIPNTKQAYEEISNKNLKSLDESDYEVFLQEIKIDPPKDYLSHHSIANEWSIYSWAEFLKVYDSEAIKTNKAKIENMLYFKYLKAKYPLPSKSGLSIVPKPPKAQGNVLLIDDEWNKGWGDIFEKYFSSSQNITFNILKGLSKDSNYETIENTTREFLEKHSVSLILLDIRLTKEDHEIKDETNLSGIKLLSLIKSFNPGIQVILLTASQKSNILNVAQSEYNILGYIKKEAPDNDANYTKESFKILTPLLDKGLEKEYLLHIWNVQREILNLEMFKNEKYNQIKIEVNLIFDILDSNVNEEKKYKFAMLTIYKILETVKDLYVDDNSKYKDNKKEIKTVIFKNQIYSSYSKDVVDKNPYEFGFYDTKSKTAKQNFVKFYYSTENKIKAIMFDRLCIKEKDIYESIEEINQKRNKYIHPDYKNNPVEVTSQNVVSWFKILHKILTRQNTTTL